MSIYFISDLHLDHSNQILLDSLSQLIDQLITQRATALYILGDFFEAWIGDDVQAPWLTHTIKLLNKLSAKNCKIYFMHGNRDFLVSQELCNRFNGELIPDPKEIDLFGTPALILHGDSLCIDDHEYQAFRSQVRSESWQKDFLSKPLEEREAIAKSIRAESRLSSSHKTLEILDVTPSEVSQVFKQYSVQRMIHGHTHRPDLHQTQHTQAANSYQRWVLGDWYVSDLNQPKISYLVASPKQLKLVAGNRSWTSSL